jgi:hypothetical protein
LEIIKKASDRILMLFFVVMNYQNVIISELFSSGNPKIIMLPISSIETST